MPQFFSTLPTLSNGQQAKLIRLDRAEIDRMTEDSLRQIDRHNARWKRHCQPKRN